MRKDDDATADELQTLLLIRRAALDAVAMDAALEGPVEAVNRVGWRAVIKNHGRDRDGSLKASVTVTAPHLAKPYVRKVRLVPERDLG